jgi:hypothetical protein
VAGDEGDVWVYEKIPGEPSGVSRRLRASLGVREMSASIPRTYLTRFGRPNRDCLSRELGFKVPLRFSEFAGQIYDFANGDAEKCLDAFDAALGLHPEGSEARYFGTPPELFPVGRTGCDGEHYGFLLHAPELDRDDLPFATYCPMDSEGIYIFGSTTERGIAAVMARSLSYDFLSDAKKSQTLRVAEACGITPQVEPNPVLNLPKGWRYLPSCDGVGTMAPAEWFDPQPILSLSCQQSQVPCVEAAGESFRRGYLATALHYYREALWNSWSSKPYKIAELLIEVYSAMNRNLLATEMQNTIKRWQEASRWRDSASGV